MAKVPATIGRYTVQRVLGRGGMGTVYLASDPLIEREVAIKVLPLAGADEYSERLIAEARVSGRLIHPHIVGVFDLGEEQGQPFVVMPYVEGRTLAAVLTDADRPSMDAKLRWMSQLCDALAYAHERRVIHRDVKPTNLLIDSHGHLRVLDFGIAKVLTTSQIQFTSVGTPAYMAPEQYSSDPVDPRTDVFSAGLVFYELLTHRRALTGTTPAQIYGQLMGAPMPRVLAAAPDVDPALVAVCERAMARDPRERFQTARAFAEAIEAARRTTPSGAMAITAPTVIAAPPPLPPPPEPPPPPPPPPPETPLPFVPPADVEPAPTIRLEPPDHDAVLEEEALAAPPEFEPEPVEEDDDRTALRPGAQVFTVLLVIALAVLASVLFYLGSKGTQVSGEPASGPSLQEHVATPALQHRDPPTWVRGPRPAGCKAAQPSVPLFFGDTPVAIYAAAAGCGPDGTPDRRQTMLFAETPGRVQALYRPRSTDGTLSARMTPALDGRRVLFVDGDTWYVVRTADGHVDATMPAKGPVFDLSANGSTLAFGGMHGRIGLFDVDTVETTAVPDTSDGAPPDSPATFAGMSDNGRFVLFWSSAANLVGGSLTGGSNALYRYDRTTAALHLVDDDLGTRRHDVYFTAVVSDDGDWIVYQSMRRRETVVPDFVPAGSLYLYAHRVSAARAVLIDLATTSGAGQPGIVTPLALIDANVLLYSRDFPGVSTIDYLWQPLRIASSPTGQLSPRRIGCDRRTLGETAPPARMSPRCLRWNDGSSWCMAGS